MALSLIRSVRRRRPWVGTPFQSAAAVAAPTFRSVNHNSGTGTDILVDKPTGAALHDTLIFTMVYNSTSVTITPPSGTTLLSNKTYGTYTERVYYIADYDGTTTPYEFGVSSSVTWDVACLAYYNCDNTNPVNVWSEYVIPAANNTTAIAQSVTSTVTGGALVTLYTADHTISSWSTPASPSTMTPRYSDASMACFDLSWPSAATTGNVSSNLDTPSKWSGVNIVLKGSGGAGPLAASALEAIELADVITRKMSYVRQTVEGVQLADKVDRKASAIRSIIEAIQFADVLSQKVYYSRSIIEAIQFADKIDRKAMAARSVVEAAQFAEVISRQSNAIRSIVEAIQLADLVTATKQGPTSISVAEAIQLADKVDRKATAIRSVVEAVQLADITTVVGPSGPKTIPVVEALQFADLITQKVFYSRQTVEALQLADKVDRKATAIRSVIEAIQLADLVTATKQGPTSIGVIEAIQLADKVDRKATAIRSVVEALEFAEVISRKYDPKIGVIEAIQIADAIQAFRLGPGFILIKEGLLLAEVVNRAATLSRSMIDALQLADLNSRRVLASLLIIESVQTAEVITRKTTGIRSIAEAVGLADQVTRKHLSFRYVKEAINFNDAVIAYWKVVEGLTLVFSWQKTTDVGTYWRLPVAIIANIIVFRGADYTLTFKDKNSPATDITGWYLAFTVKATPKENVPILISKTFGNGLTVPTPTNGQIVVALNRADTVDLVEGRYHYDLRRINAGQENMLAHGVFDILPSVR